MSATQARPWLRFYGDVPATLEYPAIRVDEAVARSAARAPDAVAYDFLGTRATYRELQERIERCAHGLAALGLGAGDRITISMPTSPQGVIAFYAASRLGAVSSMIHPLSAPAEIAHYLTLSNSRFALTLDAFYGQFAQIRASTPLETLILARIGDELSPAKRIGFWATRGRKIPAVPAAADVVWWRDVAKGASGPLPTPTTSADDLATILYSGGTTGLPKGIMLSHATSRARPCRSRPGWGSRSAMSCSQCCRSSTASASGRSSMRASSAGRSSSWSRSSAPRSRTTSRSATRASR